MSAAYKNIIRDHKLSHRLIPVFNVAPELELACSRVADFIGERFMGDKGPLAAEMIESALEGFRRAKRTGDQHIAFMQGLFEPSKALYARRLCRSVWRQSGGLVSDGRGDSRVRSSATLSTSSRWSMSVARTRSLSAPRRSSSPHVCFRAKLSAATSRNMMSLTVTIIAKLSGVDAAHGPARAATLRLHSTAT